MNCWTNYYFLITYFMIYKQTHASVQVNKLNSSTWLATLLWLAAFVVRRTIICLELQGRYGSMGNRSAGPFANCGWITGTGITGGTVPGADKGMPPVKRSVDAWKRLPLSALADCSWRPEALDDDKNVGSEVEETADTNCIGFKCEGPVLETNDGGATWKLWELSGTEEIDADGSVLEMWPELMSEMWLVGWEDIINTAKNKRQRVYTKFQNVQNRQNFNSSPLFHTSLLDPVLNVIIFLTNYRKKLMPHVLLSSPR